MTDEQPQPLSEPGLDSLLLSLAAAALAYMGHDVVPGQKTEVNLPLAKQTVDTIAMLRTKTEGNRTDAETKMFDELLYELRLQFVKAEEAAPSKPRSGLIIDPSNPDR